MSLEKLNPVLCAALSALKQRGTSKRDEPIITGIVPARSGHGPRVTLAGHGQRRFLRMNSNSYLGLELDARVIAAERQTAERVGTGPGAVRFISGTHESHVALELQLAAFHGRESALLMSSAYAAVLGALPQLISDQTLVISDALNHNCIINAIRLAAPLEKAVYRHRDMAELERILISAKGRVRRALVVTDGVFSMRGDHAPLSEISRLCADHENDFPEGIITVLDDSHGVGALGRSGRGSEEQTGARADVLIATLGKALGVNGGYVASSRTVVDFLRETAPLYIYSNPITPAEAAAASTALAILDGNEGARLLQRVRELAGDLRRGLAEIGLETIAGEHPIVPVLIRDTAHTTALVQGLFDHDVLVTGLGYPVVPRGEEEIRLQVCATHTPADIRMVLDILADPG